MRKQKKNQFILLTNATEKNVKSLLSFTIEWFEDNGMSAEKSAGLKCAVCEALSNVIAHAYNDEFKANTVQIDGTIFVDDTIKVAVRDEGRGIADINQAMTSLFSTGPEDEHSGMGFTVMEAFVDKVKVRSEVGKGTSVLLFHTLN